MKAYSPNLRERVVKACEEGTLFRREIAERFSVTTWWIRRLFRLRRETGSIAPKPHGAGHPPAFDSHTSQRLAREVSEDPDATLDELRERCGVLCSIQAASTTLLKLGLTQKKSLRASEQVPEDVKVQREQWPVRIQGLDSSRLVFLDESGAKINITRLRGRAPRGQRVYDSAPHGHGHTTTMFSLIRLDGSTACPPRRAVEGATDTDVFMAYVENVLVPAIHPGDIVIMDNLSPHKSPAVATAIRAAGAEIWHLPPYSPDFNPIEQMWSKVKEALRAFAARTQEDLVEAIAKALRSLTASDAQGWFTSCGYRCTQS